MVNRTLAALAAALVLCSAGAVAQTFTLRYLLENGASYRYADSLTMNMTQEMMGQEMQIATTAFTLLRLQVEATGKGGAMTLLLVPDSMYVSVKSPRGDTALVLRDMMGKRSRTTLAPDGKLGNREIVDSVNIRGMLRGLAMREPIRFPRLPASAVRVGEKWTITDTDTVAAGEGREVVHSTTNYSLEGKESRQGYDCLRISFSGTMTTVGRGRMMGMEYFREGTGKTRGTFCFAPKPGLLVAEETAFETESTTALTGQQNMTIPSTQSGKRTRVLLR